MRALISIPTCILLLAVAAGAASKAHSVTFGKWTTIVIRNPESNLKPTDLKIRPLYLDGRTKEFTTGPAHDVTERTFVVQRIYRVNDSLPQESGPQKWNWQRGGWLLVNRASGKIQPIVLPDFDPDLSAVNWYRDYAAYCGDSEDGGKIVTAIVQLGRRKALLKKTIGDASESGELCPPPIWERNPIRATFELKSGQKLTFSVKNRATETVTEDDSESGE